jgi:hypothetical protein
MKDRGMDINTASMQALLWYPEKELYLNNGVGNEKAKPTDYSIEFGKLAEQQGFSKQRVAGARSRAVNRRAAASVGATGETTGRQGRGPGLAKEARQQLVHSAAARQIAQLDKGAYAQRVPKGTDRIVAGAPVVQVHKPGQKAKNTLERSGLPSPTFMQLAHSPKGAEVFRKAASKAGIPVLSANEYEGMRTFLSPDGMMGFALDGEVIVSSFKNPKSKAKGVAHAMSRLAIEQGARRIVVPEGPMPHVYAMHGFKAVARNGDSVYMVWDRHSDNSYEATQGQVVETAEAATDISISESANLMTRNAPDGKILLRLEEDINVVEDPSSPLAQLQKLAATQEAMAKQAPADARGLKAWLASRAHGKNAGNIEKFLALIPRRHLADFVQSMSMPSVAGYLRNANRMEGRRNELVMKQGEVGKRWSKYIRESKDMAILMGELMHGGTLSGVDPAAQYKPKHTGNMSPEKRAVETKRRSDYRILRKWWDKLDTEGQEIYVEVRNEYLKQRTRVEAALMNRIKQSEADPKSKVRLMDTLRKQFESGRVDGPYFPLARFGELWASAKDADGNTVAFSRFEHVIDQNEWQAAMKEAGYAIDGGKKMDDIAVVGQIDPQFAAKVTTMVKGMDPSMADEIWQLYLNSMPDISIRKGFMHRTGRLGFTNDAMRAFGHQMFHGAHQIAKMEHLPEMEKDMRAMKADARMMEQRNDKDALWGTSIYREMTRRHKTAMNPQSAPWATKLTALGFAWYLGTTPAAAFVNMTQTAIVGLPVLAAEYGWVKSSAELAKAAALWASSYGPTKNRLRGDELKAFEEAERNGLFDKTQSHDLAGVADQGMDHTGKMHATMEVISYLFHKVEQANREVTFLASYRAARDLGMTHNDSVRKSDGLVWDAHFDYSVANRPRIMQGDVARVLLLFRQYSGNMTYRITRDFNDSFRHLDPAAKKKARTRFKGMMGMTALFAGTTGLPMFWVVEGIINALMGDEDEEFDVEASTRAWMTEAWGEDISDVIARGPMDKLTGATISSRVSLNNLWVREVPQHLEGGDRYLHLVGEAAGPVGAIAKDALFMAPQELSEGNIARAVEYFTPKVIKDNVKSNRYLREGVKNRRGDVVISKEELTSWDLALQSAGFTPAKVTKQYEINRAVKKAEGHIIRRKEQLMNRLFLAFRHGDKKQVAKTMDSIRKYNQVNPSYTIAPGKVIASAKARGRFSMESKGGVRLNKNLRYLHGKYDF